MKTLLLLHGAIGAQDQLQPLKELLSAHYNVQTLSFSGHGGNAFSEDGFSIARFSVDVLNYLNDNKIEQADVFGYSMGGYVAMYLAKQHPARVGRIITLATKFHWDEPTAQKECGMLDAEKIAAKVPAFAAALAQRHSPNDWKELMNRTKDMLIAMGNDNPLKLEDYKAIENPSLIMLGDRDKMITLDETLAVYKTLPNAQMAMLPDTQHPIEQVDVQHLAYMIQRFAG
jgi:pimeloyl-ACP methyl ester carboxylesterase